MGLWDKPVAVEVESDDDHGVEELLKRGWKVRLLTGRDGDGVGLRYPDLEVKPADEVDELSNLLGELDEGRWTSDRETGGGGSVVERVRFGPWVKASEWLKHCAQLPKHVILRGPVAAEEVLRVVELGYRKVCRLLHYEWPSGGAMPRVLDYEPLGEIRALNAAEEWFLKWEEKGPELKIGMAVRSNENEKSSSASSSSKSGDAPRVGILVAALGSDCRHLHFFLESVSRNFLPDARIGFVVFSDRETPPGKDIHGIRVAVPEGGNGNLERYRWILEAEKACADFDFLVLMKPQVRVMERVGMDEILSAGCVASNHSAYEGETRAKIRFEENEQSVAWVGPREGVSYACGSWQGGAREEFLDTVRTMENWISEDEANGVRPYWGDESYWNRYCIDFPPQRMLGAEYAWRVESKAPRDRDPKVVVLQDHGMAEEKPRRFVRLDSPRGRRMEPVVNGLWIGGDLPPLAELCIRSYLHHGFGFRLYAYGKIGNAPQGCEVCDAHEILSEGFVFQDESGGYAPFSDWFRFRLLHGNGGI